MTDIVRLHFLGSVLVERGGEPLSGFKSRKALALLGYLSARGQPATRLHLADLFWGDLPETRGRANLSWALNHISSLLPGCLLTDRQSVQLDSGAQASWVDTVAFDELAAQGGIASLAAAVELYRGDFMADIHLKGCPEFETWQIGAQEHWRRRLAHVLHDLIKHHGSRGEYDEGLRYASGLLALDPWREEAHRQAMLLLARSGQRSAALAQYETCRRTLVEELGVEPSEETTALYENIRAGSLMRRPEDIVAAGGATPAPALPVAAARREAPPPHLAEYEHFPPLIGRETELAQIAEYLADPVCRLLTLTGPGGVGKTHLALEAAVKHAQVFSHGVYYAPLAPLSAPELLVSTIADNLGFSFDGEEDPKIQLLRTLREKSLLLVLDNFEHLLAGTDLLSEIAATAPEVKLLVTSREPLNLHMEWRLALGGLSYPGSVEAAEVDQRTQSRRMGDYAAVKLFLQSARRVCHDYSIATADEASVTRICQLAQGLPLAIELAAAWVRVLSCREIAEQLESSFDLLSTSLVDVPERHRNMQAVFEHSWNLLTVEEQSILPRLSVFRGSFSHEAAAQVADASLLHIASLTDKSLLRAIHSGHSEMHEHLRQYAAEKLAANPAEETATHQKHTTYYAAIARHLQDESRVHKPTRTAAALETEINNLRAALDWAIAQQDAPGALQLCVALRVFWRMRCHFSEGRRYFQEALALPGDAPEAVRATALRSAGYFALDQGDYLAAQTVGKESLDCFRELDDKAGMAETFHMLAMLASAQSDLTTAHALGTECLSIWRELGDREWIVRTLNKLGTVVTAQGDFAAAGDYLEECLTLALQSGEQYDLALVYRNLGILALEREEYAAAMMWLRESLALAWEMGDKLNAAKILETMAERKKSEGRAAEAVRLLHAAYTLRENIGAPLPPAQQNEHDKTLAALRAEMSAAIFSEACDQGRSPEEVVREMLGDKRGAKIRRPHRSA